MSFAWPAAASAAPSSWRTPIHSILLWRTTSPIGLSESAMRPKMCLTPIFSSASTKIAATVCDICASRLRCGIFEVRSVHIAGSRSFYGASARGAIAVFPLLAWNKAAGAGVEVYGPGGYRREYGSFTVARRNQTARRTQIPGRPRPGLDHRSLGRRPKRHRHLFSGRGAIWLYAGLDALADLSVDVRDPDDQRPGRTGHRIWPRRKHAPLLSGPRALSPGRPPGCRQHDQSWRGPRRDGRRLAPARRRARPSSISAVLQSSRSCSKCSRVTRAMPRSCGG